MLHTEKSVCKEFGIAPEQLKANINEEQYEAYLKQMKKEVFIALGVSNKYLVSSNG